MRAATATASAGLFGGVWTAGETTGMALGATALTVVLAASGYVVSVGNAAVDAADQRRHRHRAELQPGAGRAHAGQPVHARPLPLRKSDIDAPIPTVEVHP